MRAWRITAIDFQESALSGRGGLEHAGRWHRAGQPVVYCAQSPSLAVLEMLVNTSAEDAPEEFALLELELPDSVQQKRCEPSSLAREWRSAPGPAALQEYGTEWLAGKRSAVLNVPSAVMPLERNYLINPQHPDAKKIRLMKRHRYVFDARLR